MSVLPYYQAEEFEAMINKRDLSSDARRFVLLMHSAANGSPASEIEGRYVTQREPMYVMVCTAGQERLAELCGFRTRTGLADDRQIRAVCQNLTQLGVLVKKTKPQPNGGSETQYYLSVSRLVELPTVDLTTPIGRAVAALSDWDPFAEIPTGEPTGEPTGHVHVHGKHMNKTHDHGTMDHGTMDHVSFSNSFSNAVDEPTGNSVRPPGREPRNYEISITNLPESHINRIVKNYDSALFEDYFRDLLKGGWAKDCDNDRNQVAALFHHVCKLTELRRKTKDPIAIPGAMLVKKWKHRKDPKRLLILTTADEEFASDLRRKSIVSQRSHHSVVPPSLATSAAVAAFGE